MTARVPAAVAAFVCVVATALPCSGHGKLPAEMAGTAYDTGSSGFNIAIAVGQQFTQKYGTDVRVLPSGNDIGRLALLRAGRAVMSAMGFGAYFAQEGVIEIGRKSWGPLPARLIMTTTSCNGITLGVARDTGVREMKDLKGKRLAVVVGSPALTQGARAPIARQQVIAAAWQSCGADAPADEQAFAAGWLKARAEVPKKAGMDVIFE